MDGGGDGAPVDSVLRTRRLAAIVGADRVGVPGCRRGASLRCSCGRLALGRTSRPSTSCSRGCRTGRGGRDLLRVGPGHTADAVRRIRLGRPRRSRDRDVRHPDSGGHPAEPRVRAGIPACGVQHVRRVPRQGIPSQARPGPSPSCGYGGDRASQHLRGTRIGQGNTPREPTHPTSNPVVGRTGRYRCRRRRRRAGAGTEPRLGERFRGCCRVDAVGCPSGPDRRPGSCGALARRRCGTSLRASSCEGWTTLNWHCSGPETRPSFAS